MPTFESEASSPSSCDMMLIDRVKVRVASGYSNLATNICNILSLYIPNIVSHDILLSLADPPFARKEQNICHKELSTRRCPRHSRAGKRNLSSKDGRVAYDDLRYVPSVPKRRPNHIDLR